MDIPKNRNDFFTLLHEIGHSQHPKGFSGSRLNHQLAADIWAIQKSKELGINLTRKNMVWILQLKELAKEVIAII